MTIKATFIGESGNGMGFIHGRGYEIRTNCKNIRKRVGGLVFGHTEDLVCLCVYDVHSSAWCPYTNLESMLRNWKIHDTQA